MRTSRRVLTAVLATVSFMLPATAGATPTYGTQTLDASEVWTSSHRSHEWHTGACGWALGKLNDRLKPNADTALVGYVNAYDEYSWLFWTCWEKDDYAYRARTVFDLGELGDNVVGIKKAVLRYHESVAAEQTPDGDLIRYADERTAHCATRLLAATSPPGTGFAPGVVLGTIKGSYSMTKGPIGYVVTDAVRKWFDGDRPNYGFVFRGSESYGRDYGACLSTLADFQLKLTFWQK